MIRGPKVFTKQYIADHENFDRTKVVDDFVGLRLFIMRFFHTIGILTVLFFMLLFADLFTMLAEYIINMNTPTAAIINAIFNATLTSDINYSVGRVRAGCYILGSQGSCLPELQTTVYTPILSRPID